MNQTWLAVRSANLLGLVSVRLRHVLRQWLATRFRQHPALLVGYAVVVRSWKINGGHVHNVRSWGRVLDSTQRYPLAFDYSVTFLVVHGSKCRGKSMSCFEQLAFGRSYCLALHRLVVEDAMHLRRGTSWTKRVRWIDGEEGHSVVDTLHLYRSQSWTPALPMTIAVKSTQYLIMLPSN